MGGRLWGISAIRARTSVNQASGSTSLRRAVPKRPNIIVARWPPRSEPTNNHVFLPRATLNHLRTSTPAVNGSVHRGARIGITAVLHTCVLAMTHHPHVHMIVPGAASHTMANAGSLPGPPSFYPYVYSVNCSDACSSPVLLWRYPMPDAGRIRTWGQIAENRSSSSLPSSFSLPPIRAYTNGWFRLPPESSHKLLTNQP